MAHMIRSTSDAGENGGSTAGHASDHGTAGTAPSVSPGTPASTAGEVRPVTRARHIAGRLAALPRLARRADAPTESAAERIARRRRVAQATLDAESGAGAADWARVGVFGAGLAFGALLGAGVALLLAPAAGDETRTRIARRARSAGGRAPDGWDDVRDDSREKTWHGARPTKSAATTSRWAVDDAWERHRRN